MASVISLVGIGIIAIPTRIIAAGFSRAISKDAKDEIDSMSEEDLLLLEHKVSKKLSEHGYETTVRTKAGEKGKK